MAIQTAPNSKPGSLFFTDARTCKEWLKSIPLTNIAQAQQNILDSLRVLNRSPEFVALERLTCMELMRAKVAFLLTALPLGACNASNPPPAPDSKETTTVSVAITELK